MNEPTPLTTISQKINGIARTCAHTTLGKSLLPALMLTLLATAASAGPITYTGNRTVGNVTVNLSFTTDGTIGALAQANYLDFTIVLTSGLNSATLKPSNTTSRDNSFALTATANTLSFNFSAAVSLLIQNSSTNTFYSIQGNQNTFDFGGPAEGVGSFGNNPNQRLAGSGILVIATAPTTSAAPEPASIGLTLLGLSSVFVLRKRRT